MPQESDVAALLEAWVIRLHRSRGLVEMDGTCSAFLGWAVHVRAYADSDIAWAAGWGHEDLTTDGNTRLKQKCISCIDVEPSVPGAAALLNK